MTYRLQKLFQTGLLVADRNQVIQASAFVEGISVNGIPLPPSYYLGDVRTTAQIIFRSPFYTYPIPPSAVSQIDLLVTVEYDPSPSVYVNIVAVTRLTYSIKAVQ
jgi:hypothetical protein